MIFFSLTEAPLPDPAPTPPNTPKRTRNGPEKEPKRSQTEPNGAETEPNGAEMDRNSAFRGGTGGGGVVGVGGMGGVVREKENHYNCPTRGVRKMLVCFVFIVFHPLRKNTQHEPVGGIVPGLGGGHLSASCAFWGSFLGLSCLYVSLLGVLTP